MAATGVGHTGRDMPSSHSVAPDQPDHARGATDKTPREVWVLVVAAFCVAIGYGIVAPVLPAYAASFDVSIQAASAIVSVFAAMRLVCAPAAGTLVGRLGERAVYLTGLLIVAVSTGLCAFATSYLQLLLFRGVGGIGSTMFTVSAMALLIRLTPPAIRGRVASLYGAGFLVGTISGPVLGGLLSGFGYRVPFVVYACTLLAAAAVVAFSLSGTTLRAGAGAEERTVMALREALADSAYRSLLVSGFCNGWANFGIRVSLLPLFAAAIPGLGVAWAGVALTVFGIGNAAALSVTGRAVDRIGRKPLIMGGLLVSGLGTAAVGLAHNAVVLLVVSLIGGAGAGVLNPAQQACVSDVVGNERNGGTVLATYQMCQDAGTIAGPIVAGGIADAAGFGWAFGISGVLSLIAVIAWMPGRETLPHVSAAALPGVSRPFVDKPASAVEDG